MRREGEIVKACLDYLRLRGAVVCRTNTGMLRLGSGKSARVLRTGAPGWADITGVFKRHAIAVECKRPLGPRGGTGGSELTDDQQGFRERWICAGGRYCLARCVDDVQDFLDGLEKA